MTSRTGVRDEPATSRWITSVRWALRLGLWILIAGIVAQSYLAGRALFAGGTFGPHADLGFPLAHLLAPLLLIVSAFARLGWRTHFTVASLLLLVVVQPTLALIRSDFPGVAALHPLNALVMFAGCVWIETKLHRLLRVR